MPTLELELIAIVEKLDSLTKPELIEAIEILRNQAADYSQPMSRRPIYRDLRELIGKILTR